MKSKFLFIFGLSLGGLVSCTQYHSQSYSYTPDYQGYQYGEYEEYASPGQSYGQYSDYQQRQGSRGVSVPESYHVGSYRSPVSPKNRDSRWVSQQNPQGYTIQIAEGRKASSVAGSLTKAPKRNRMATVKSFSNGAAYFRGVYGSYSSYEDAKSAMNDLPSDLKGRAQIKQWNAVQQ